MSSYWLPVSKRLTLEVEIAPGCPPSWEDPGYEASVEHITGWWKRTPASKDTEMSWQRAERVWRHLGEDKWIMAQLVREYAS